MGCCLCSLKIHVLKFCPLRRWYQEVGVFGRWLGHEDRALINRINSSLIKRGLTQFGHTFHHLRTSRVRMCHLWRRKLLSSDLESAGNLILDFLGSRTVENKFLLFISYPSIVFFNSSPNGLSQYSKRLTSLRLRFGQKQVDYEQISFPRWDCFSF